MSAGDEGGSTRHPTYDEWLAEYDPDVWAEDRQMMATDIVVMTIFEGALSVLLTKRTEWPERGAWVLPGGFVRRNDRFDDTASRVLKVKAGIESVPPLTRLNFFDHPARDPRTKVGSLAYLCLVGPSEAASAARDGLRALGTVAGDKVQIDADYVRLGFDHNEILGYALNEARRHAQADPLWIVPALSDARTFTITGLNAARGVLGLAMTEDALRRRVAKDPRAAAAGWIDGGTGKPSRLYQMLL